MVKDNKQKMPDIANLLFSANNQESQIDPQFEKLYDLLKDFMNAEPNNLDLKTEIPVPLKTAIFKLLSNYLKQRNMHKSAELLDDFLIILFRYMFSNKRLSRKEFMDIFKSLVSSPLSNQENVVVEDIETTNKLNRHLRM